MGFLAKISMVICLTKFQHLAYSFAKAEFSALNFEETKQVYIATLQKVVDFSTNVRYMNKNCYLCIVANTSHIIEHSTYRCLLFFCYTVHF